MTEKEFIKLYNEFKLKFPKLNNSFVLLDTGKELHTASEGNALEVIKSIVELSNNNEVFFSIFLTVGEYLSSTLDNKQIQGLTRINLEKFTRENSN